MKDDVFAYDDYKEHLSDWIVNQPHRGRGAKSKLARVAGCRPAYVSQVLNGSLNFSLEQAQAISTHLGHSKENAHYFLLLIQKARAGTHKLQSYFDEQIQETQKKRFVLKDRLGVSQHLTAIDHQRYYSSWIYAAIHVMTDIPEYRTKEAIAERLGISLPRVSDILDFLINVGLVVVDDKGFKLAIKSIHLGNDSPLISKHHTNWRLRAIESLVEENDESLHYSSAITLSRNDWLKVKSQLIDTIQKVKTTVRQTKDEAIFCFSLDLFEL